MYDKHKMINKSWESITLTVTNLPPQCSEHLTLREYKSSDSLWSNYKEEIEWGIPEKIMQNAVSLR